MHVENITSNAMSLDRNGQSMLIQVYEKEIDRLNNIINELEKWIEEHKQYQLISERYIVWEDKLVNKLKALKENNK